MKYELTKIIAVTAMLATASVATAQTDAPPAKPKIRIVLVGDSTVNDGGGWGYGSTLNTAGRVVFARLVAGELRQATPELAPFLLNEPADAKPPAK